MKILRRYLARSLLWTTLLALAVLVALFAFFALIDQLEETGRGNYGVPQALIYVLLIMPGLASELFPIAATIGSMATLGIMTQNNELTIIRASGVSNMRLAALMVRAGILIVVLAIINSEVVAPYSEEKAQNLRSLSMTQQITMKTKYGFWARDGNSYINIRKILPGRRVEQIYIYEFDENSLLRTSTYAKQASYMKDRWLLMGIQQTRVDGEKIQSRRMKQAAWESLLDPEMLNLIIIKPQYLNLVGLAGYIKYLHENSQDSRIYDQALWAKLVRPFSILVMIVLAVPMVRVHLRSMPLGQRVFQGALAGILFHILSEASGNMGMVYGITSAISVTAPTLVLTGVLLWLLRDGKQRS